MKVESLHIYPVKGLRGVNPDSAVLEPRGFAQDRRWMLVDETGRFLTQREHPKLATLEAQATADGLRIADGANAIWATVPDDRALWRIDPKTNRTKRIALDYYPWGVTLTNDEIWVVVRAHDD